MIENGWCVRHWSHLHEVKDARVAIEPLIVKLLLETGRRPGSNGCWACPLSENEFQAALREGSTLVAKTVAYGGTYTADGIAIAIGPGSEERVMTGETVEQETNEGGNAFAEQEE